MMRRNVKIWMTVIASCLSSSQVMGVIEFKDGQTHDIDYEIADDVWVDNQAPGKQTTVNWLEGASTSWHALEGFEDSKINIRGGSIGTQLWAHGSSQVTMSGGSIGHDLLAFDSSQVTISDGSIGERLYARASSQVTMSGGSVVGWLWAYGNSQVTISGGSIRDYLDASSSSQVTMSGGRVGRYLIADHDAILTLHGSDFALDGEALGYGELTSLLGGFAWDEPRRHLTGILASGESIDNVFLVGHDARIVLVPEPAAVLLLGLGGLMLLHRPSPLAETLARRKYRP